MKGRHSGINSLEFVMLSYLSQEIANCYQRAAECGDRAANCADADMRPCFRALPLISRSSRLRQQTVGQNPARWGAELLPRERSWQAVAVHADRLSDGAVLAPMRSYRPEAPADRPPPAPYRELRPPW